MKQSSFCRLVLGLGFLFAGASVFAADLAGALESSESADIIVINAKVLTVDTNFTIAQSVAIRGGRIIAVGKDRLLEKLRGPNTRVIDAQDRIVMPGLYDASVHSYAAAVSELKGPVSNIDSIVAAQDYIRRQASNKPPSGWIILSNLYPTRLKEGRLPFKADLDAATTNYAVLWNFGPMAVVNSKALELSKITKDTMDPENGQVDKDVKHRNPTGLLRNATSLLKLPPAPAKPTRQQERNALKALYALYNQQGITSIGEAETGPEQIDLFRDLSRSNELTLRINCTRVFEPGTDIDAAVDRLNALTNGPTPKLPYGPTGAGDDWVRIGPLKTVIDGDINTGTAYLRTPYGIGPTYRIDELAYRGASKQDAFVLPQYFVEAAQRGWQLAGHASGDAALDSLLNAYETAQFQQNIRDRRFLVLDSDFQAAQNWARCVKLGLGVVIEPNDLYLDGGSLLKSLGQERLNYFVPMKGWFDRDLQAGAASDHLAGLDSLASVNPWNPWLGMWTTLTRQTRQGDVLRAEEQLTREQAVRLYTYNNAWIHLEEKQKGSLEPGKLADLVVLDTDILKCPVDQIRNTKVLMTIVNGKVVWEASIPAMPGPYVFPSITVIPTNQPNGVALPPVVATPVSARTPFSPLGVSFSSTNSAHGAAIAVATNQSDAVSSGSNVISAVIADSIGASNAAAASPSDAALSGGVETNPSAELSALPAAPVAVSSSTNQATVVTVSNETASVTITIQPTAHAGSNIDNAISATNQMAAPGSVPVDVSTNAAASSVPEMDSTATNAANSAKSPAESTPVATSKSLFDWSRLFGSSQ